MRRSPISRVCSIDSEGMPYVLKPHACSAPLVTMVEASSAIGRNTASQIADLACPWRLRQRKASHAESENSTQPLISAAIKPGYEAGKRPYQYAKASAAVAKCKTVATAY